VHGPSIPALRGPACPGARFPAAITPRLRRRALCLAADL